LAQSKKQEENEEEVSTNEDLMREHGILQARAIGIRRDHSPNSRKSGLSAADGH